MSKSLNQNQIIQLNKMMDDGYVIRQSHPTLDLFIYNYSDKTQYDSKWNEITLMCRGLVLNFNYEIICHCLKKFFNYDEIKFKTKVDLSKPHTATTKMDGSYGQMFFYLDQQIFSSRGSFTSEQAIKLEEIYKKKYSHIELNKNYSFIVEIIYPTNRIVIDYGDIEDFFLITVIDNETGEEFSYDWICKNYSFFNIVKRHDFNNMLIEKIQALNLNNEEGYVFHFPEKLKIITGDSEYFVDRLKSKFEDYVKLHRIITNVSTRTIWNYLKDKKPLKKILENVPDEFYVWVNKTIDDLQEKFNSVFNLHTDIYSNISFFESRKLYADMVKLLCKQNSEINSSILFNLYTMKYSDAIDPNNIKLKNITDTIWDLIEPKFEKPFKQDNLI